MATRVITEVGHWKGTYPIFGTATKSSITRRQSRVQSLICQRSTFPLSSASRWITLCAARSSSARRAVVSG